MHVFCACMLVFCKLFIHVSLTAGSCNEVKIESLKSSSVNAFYDLTSEDVGGKPVHKSVDNVCSGISKFINGCLLTLLTQILHMHIMR